MEFLTLIANGIKAVVTWPMTVYQSTFRAKAIRQTAERGKVMVGEEVEALTPGRAFFRGTGRVLLVLIFAAAVGGAFYGLWYLNRWLDLERQLGGPVPWLRPYWLPLLFLLFLAACLAGLWLWRLLGPLGEPTDFPDIHAAWVEARSALQQEGIAVTDVPVYLVLGRPAGGVGAVFAASRLAFPVRGVPGRGDAPVQVYANAKGVYVACPGVSLLSRLAEILADQGGGSAAPPAAAARTVFDDAGEPDPAAAPASAPPVADGPLLLPDDEPPATPASGRVHPGRRTPRLIENAEEVERAAARLRYLGRLLAHNREPYCGANGIVLLVPFAACGGPAEAHQAAAACRLDLDAARDGLKTDCPVFGVVCDLEAAPGAAEFLRLVPDDRKDRLLGHPFPLAPDLPADRLPAEVAAGLGWAGAGLERLILRGLRPGEGGEDLRANVGLYRFLAAVRTREPHVAHVFGKAAAGADGRPAKFGGAFLAATGPDPGRDQGFVAGVFRLLADHQNFVTWTPAARSADAAYHRWTVFGYLLIGLFIAAVATMGYLQWRG